MKARSKGICGALLACALFAYVGILIQGRSERSFVVDATVYGGRLAAEGSGAFNTAFDSGDGSAAIGRNYRFHSFAHWEIVSPASLASGPQAQRNETRWLYVMSEAPQFFSAEGYARVYVGNTLVGEIKSLAAKSGATFEAEPEQQSILMPPARTFGYRFPLAGDRSCSRNACNLTIRGLWMFWHVYRFAIVGEKPRFVAVLPR